MDDKKQKILVGVLAVLILGAGGVWYMNRDTSDNNRVSSNSGPTERRAKKETKDEADTSRRKTRKREEAVATGTERRVREETDRKSTTRKKRGRSSGKKVKKEKITPAA